MQNIKVQGEHTKVEGNYLYSEYNYKNSNVVQENNKYIITPQTTQYEFRTDLRIPKLGVLYVGVGGNNGTTTIGGIIANREKLTWRTKKGVNHPNFYGSISQCSTTKIGIHGSQEIFVPLRDLMPMVNPCDMIVGGWDISKLNLAEGMERAKVLDYDLQQKLKPFMEKIVPMKGIYYPDYIASNQLDRADNILQNKNKMDDLNQIRKDIQEFKTKNKLEKVVILWTANTERFSKIETGIHDTYENVMKAIQNNNNQISPSTIYCIASVLEGCPFINGSPQNTLIPGVVELAEKHNVFIMGDDFKSGQTKFKTMLTDFLVSAGLKPVSIISYNHLGNNDGKNLSSQEQFRSKEISKSSCVDDILYSNQVLFPNKEHIDHTIVIKYAPTAGDSKKALDEYVSEIFLGGKNIISTYNVCEDSLLAAPLLIDLVILTEMFTRMEWKTKQMEKFQNFHAVLSTLGYLCKAPLRVKHAPVVNSLFRQKEAINNMFKAFAGIPFDDNTLLEYRCMEQASYVKKSQNEATQEISSKKQKVLQDKQQNSTLTA